MRAAIPVVARAVPVIVVLLLLASVVSFGGEQEAATALTLRGLPWRLDPELPGFAVLEGETEDQNDFRKVVLRHKNGRRLVSFSLFRNVAGKSATEMREEGWQRLQTVPYALEQVRFWEQGDIALLEYFMEPVVEGKPIHQKNVFCYYVRDGVGISLHASSAFFRESDQAWIDGLVHSLEPVLTVTQETETEPSLRTAASVPGQDWTVELDLRGFQPDETRPAPPGIVNVGFQRAEGQMRLNVTLQPIRQGTGKEEARAFTRQLMAQSGLRIENVLEFDTEEFAFLTYNTKSDTAGRAVERKHGHAFGTHHGYMIEAFLSQWDLTTDGGKSVDTVLRSIRVVSGK